MKKLLSLALILATLLSLAGCGIPSTEPPPKIKEAEFPFSVEFIFNGKTYIYEDVVVCSFYGYDHSAWFQASRMWIEHFKSDNGYPTNILIHKEYHAKSVLDESRTNIEAKLMLGCGRGDYYMGDDAYDSAKPCFYYYETYQIKEKVTGTKRTNLTEEQLEEYFGLTVVRFEFSAPITNEFRYEEE